MEFEHPCLDIKTISQISTNSFDNANNFLDIILDVTDGLEAAVCAKDTLGKHYFVNNGYAKMLGLPRSEVLGKDDEAIFLHNPKMAEYIRNTDLKVMQNRETILTEAKMENRKNELRWYLLNKAPIYSNTGDVTGVVSLAIDITTQKELEEKSQKETQTKSTFLAKMSHEIRTPIGAISGYLELAQSCHHTTCNNQECYRYLEKMDNSVDHLLNLVDDILDLSSIEKSKITLIEKNFSALQAFNSVIENLQHKAHANNVTIMKDYHSQGNDRLLGDETRIKQIVFNLLSNAIKYAHNGNVEIRVRVKHNRHRNQSLLNILVKDNGIGIAPDKRKFVFKAFEQLNNSSHFFEGSGLGLSIVKELSGLMNGKLKMFSQLAKGTIVAISIPLAPAEYEDLPIIESTVNHKKNKLNGKIICIVEDIAFNREILETLIRLEGATPLLFKDGSELIHAIESNELVQEIDCFLIDVHMPKLSGPETLIKLREYSQYHDTPAYLITADAIKSNLEHYLATSKNLTGIFIKPIKRTQLVSILQSL